MIKKPEGHAGAFSKAKVPVRRFAIIAERILLLGGALLLAFVAVAHIHRAVMLRSALQSFEKARLEHSARSATDEAKPLSAIKEETETSAHAIEIPGSQDHASPPLAAIRHAGQVPLAILRIPKIHLEVPVLGGTDEITLNRGVGQIAGTAAPGETGNIGIAGHRDGFFRNLKDISRGDVIELQTTSSSASYVVNRILITGPDDASALRSSDKQLLTLVTCYPFHFIGPAPRRFVVQASMK